MWEDCVGKTKEKHNEYNWLTKKNENCYDKMNSLSHEMGVYRF